MENQLPQPDFANCTQPFTPCWCASRPNHPKCKDVSSVPINDSMSIIILMALAIVLAIYIQFRTRFNNAFERFYDKVGKVINGGKSITPWL